MLKRSINPYQNEFSNPFNRNIIFAELLLIIVISCIPLLITFPYHINLFLSWEGAYRLYLGQIPYKDFGIPVGFGYWLIPALFFKIFGPNLFTLIYAQTFINIISALAFRSILRSIQVEPGMRLIAILVYLISFSFFNFLPWYNHSNIVFDLQARNPQPYAFTGNGCVFFRSFSFHKTGWGWHGCHTCLSATAN